MFRAPEPWTDVLHIVGDRVHRPTHHRRHVAPPGWLTAHGLAVTHVQHPEPAELRRRRVTAPVSQIQLGCLRPTQPPPIDDLEQGGVPIGGQSALALSLDRALDLVVGVVQELLQLLAGERSRLRIALVVVEMGDGVPLVADRHRVLARPELGLACGDPAVSTVAEVLAEQAQIRLVAPNRRRRQVLLPGQRLCPLLNVRRPPPPRVLVGERDELSH